MKVLVYKWPLSPTPLHPLWQVTLKKYFLLKLSKWYGCVRIKTAFGNASGSTTVEVNMPSLITWMRLNFLIGLGLMLYLLFVWESDKIGGLIKGPCCMKDWNFKYWNDTQSCVFGARIVRMGTVQPGSFPAPFRTHGHWGQKQGAALSLLEYLSSYSNSSEDCGLNMGIRWTDPLGIVGHTDCIWI